jgi:hypothetical protein
MALAILVLTVLDTVLWVSGLTHQLVWRSALRTRLQYTILVAHLHRCPEILALDLTWAAQSTWALPRIINRS